MLPPCEIMVSDFLPNMRGLVAHQLAEKGESQRRIAIALGITQARVSYYLSSKRTDFQNELSSKFGLSEGDVQSYARVLSEEVSRSQVDGLFTLYSIWKQLLFSGAACSWHQKVTAVSSECSVCMELHRPTADAIQPKGDQELEDSSMLRELSEAVSMLESSAEFPSIMPEVSVNIAMSREKAKSGRDIAAIPGRLSKIHGRAKAFVLPEFGCSKHSSSVLLVLKSRFPALRAVMNVKYDTLLGKVLTASKIPTFFSFPREEKKSRRSSVQENKETDPVISRLQKMTFANNSSVPLPFAVIDYGSEGLEPMTYFVGSTAKEVAHLGLKVAHSYNALIMQAQ